MKSIRNPNDIVEEYVSDYRDALGDQLISVIMYGSAVTHEYVPGHSDVNIAIILQDNHIATLEKIVRIQARWNKRGIAVPFFMTEAYIASSLDTYPIEFLDMKSSHRVLYGKDVLSGFGIGKEHLRLQCERELKGIALHVRTGFVRAEGGEKHLCELLRTSFKRLMPIFKALLVLQGRNVPNIKSEIAGSVEDVYELGVSVFSELTSVRDMSCFSGRYREVFDKYVNVIDTLTNKVDTMTEDRS